VSTPVRYSVVRPEVIRIGSFLTEVAFEL